MTDTARHTVHGVTTMLASADEIDNTIILNYLAVSLPIHQLHKINATIIKIFQPKQAAASHLDLQVATSANKIANALALYYYTLSLFHIQLFVRESWLWHVFLSCLNSYFFRDALQKCQAIIF
jgi:hypothetical protein